MSSIAIVNWRRARRPKSAHAAAPKAVATRTRPLAQPIFFFASRLRYAMIVLSAPVQNERDIIRRNELRPSRRRRPLPPFCLHARAFLEFRPGRGRFGRERASLDRFIRSQTEA